MTRPQDRSSSLLRGATARSAGRVTPGFTAVLDDLERILAG